MTVNDITEAVENSATAVSEAATKAVESITKPRGGAMLPERIALRGLGLVKARARRKDVVGEIAYRGLDLFHGSLKEVASTITRLEQASQPPARTARPAAKRASASTRTRRTRRAPRRTATV